jgi:1,2-diacylglycerol 3-beta-galactosyltransferase
MQRILILMSDTGGGHRAAATAIASAIEYEFPGRYRVDLYDGLLSAAIFPFNHLDTIYFFLVTYAESLYGRIFHSTNRSWLTPLVLRLVHFAISRRITEALRLHSPDLVISVHPLLTTVPRRILRSLGSPAPFVVVVTDLFNVHELWLDDEADLYILPNEESRSEALRAGIAADKIRLTGVPVNPAFSASAGQSKAALRQKLGLDPQTTTVLLVGGGQGMGSLYEIARQVSQTDLPIQLVVIAGRNKTLLKRLSSAQWNLPVSAQGFVTNMHEWMAASDLIITKAGPATICEAMASGLPILLSGFLPGQEEQNVAFVLREGIGRVCASPADIAKNIREWMGSDRTALERFGARARELARPRAAQDIALSVNELLAARK